MRLTTGDDKCLEQIVPYHDIVVIGKSSSRPKATMVPGAAHLNLQKMQWSEQVSMLIETGDKENGCSVGFGSLESMQRVGLMVPRILFL